MEQNEQLPQSESANSLITVKQPWHQKYSGPIIIALLVCMGGAVIYALRKSSTANATVVKRDTVSAEYLLAPLGQIASGVILKDHLSDGSIMYEVPVGVDTLRGKDGQPVIDTTIVKGKDNQPIMDTVFDVKHQTILDSTTHKPRLTPHHNPKFSVHLEYRQPKYVKEIDIAPR